MSAKLTAQIEMSPNWAPIQSAPIAEARPRIVSSSGRPAATSEPKAIARMIRVTGQERNSAEIIASLLASLKSDQKPGSPVTLTATPSGATPSSSSLSRPAACDHLVLVAAGAGGEHRHRAVPGDAAVAAGLDHARDRGLRIESRVDLVHGAGDLGVLEAALAGIDDDRQRVGAEAGERVLDHGARGDRLGAAVLPAGAGQLVLGRGAKTSPKMPKTSAQKTTTRRPWAAHQDPSRPTAPPSLTDRQSVVEKKEGPPLMAPAP